MRSRIACGLLLAVTVCRPARASTDQWVEVQSPHLTVLSDANVREARQILDQFERMRWVFKALFPQANVDSAQPIFVVAAKDRKTFESMEPSESLGKGKLKLGGYFLHTLDRNYILLRLDAEYQHPYATVYHEFTHLQLASTSEWMPLWLNEGLAEFMENTEIRNKAVVLGEPNGEDILYLRDHNLIPLSVLFRVDAASPYYHEEQKGTEFYAESWALTHFLMMTDRMQHQHRLNDYIALVSHNQDPVTAAEKAFGNLDELEKALSKYVRANVYKEFAMSSEAAPIDESSYKVRVLTQVEAEALRADVLARIQRTVEARMLLDVVLKQNPSNVQAHETMGYLAIQEQNLGEARKWYAEAVKLDSQDYLAHYYFALLSMGRAGTDEDAEIESSLRTAIRLNPHFAPAYDRLAAFLGTRQEKLDEAHWLSLRAVSLDPGNVVYRMDAASVFMRMGRNSDALAALRGAARVAKSPADIAMVRKQIEQVEEIEAAGARDAEYAKQEQETRTAPKIQRRLKVVEVNPGPEHPTLPATGPQLTVTGIMRHIACYYPAGFQFEVQTAAGEAVKLYNNDFDKIDVTAVGFMPRESMNPCSDFEGMKVQARYVAAPDKSVNGEVVSMVLKK
jgi:tetratricopeptide (TPR) repeat protein